MFETYRNCVITDKLQNDASEYRKAVMCAVPFVVKIEIVLFGVRNYQLLSLYVFSATAY